MTSAGQLVQVIEPPYFILIEKSVRDEGTSYHYLPPAMFSFIDSKLKTKLTSHFDQIGLQVFTGSTWTIDAPYRETAEAIDHYKAIGIHAVEMEAAALYAFARARGRNVVCFAHVTNQMASVEGDFNKGAHNGSEHALKILLTAVQYLTK